MVEKTFYLLDMITRIYNKVIVVFTDITDFLFTNIGVIIFEKDILPPWFVQILIDLGIVEEMWLHYTFFELVLGTGVTIILMIHLFKLLKGAFL